MTRIRIGWVEFRDAASRRCLRWRRFPFAVLVGTMLALPILGAEAASGAGAQGKASLDRDFQDPPSSVRPGFVWSWPGAFLDDNELRAEIEEMVAAGFGHAQHLESPGGSLTTPPESWPPEIFGWGTRPWAEHVRAVFEAGHDNDFTFDLAPSSLWPWRSPAVSGENVELSVQQLTWAEESLTGPSEREGPVPPPPPADLDQDSARLVAVTAARRVPGTNEDGEKLLDPESVVNLTGDVEDDGSLRWGVPPGEWILFAFWQGPTRDRSATDPSGRVFDHLNRDALDAATDYLDEHLFAHLGSLPRRSGFMINEAELGTYGGRLAWTGPFLEEFQSRRGYDLTRYLPALSTSPLGMGYFSDGVSNTIYDFPGSAGERIRRDYEQTLTELWVDNHIAPATRWANGHGLKSAGRAFGAGDLGLELIATSKAYDVPDVDDAHDNRIDFARTISSGARLSGANQVSGEFSILYKGTFESTLELLKQVGDRRFAGGLNKLILEGYSYKTGKFIDGIVWPSDWWTGPPTFRQPWSPEEDPQWQHLPRLADYWARAQAVLRAGEPVTDVALYRDAYGYDMNVFDRMGPLGFPDGRDGDPGDTSEPALNSALTRSGLSFDIVNPDTVSERGTKVKRGRLVVQRPGYKALVVDLDSSKRQGFVDNTQAMAARVARRLVAFAGQGLPIVFVGRFPLRGVSYRNPEAENAALEDAVAELKQHPNVRLAEDEAGVPAALAALGVEGDLSFDGVEQSGEPCGAVSQCVYSVHRRTGKGDYWFIYNADREPTRFTGAFNTARGSAPHIWDLWSGDRRPVGLYRKPGEGRVEVPIELAPGESTVIAFTQGGNEKHVISTTAEDVLVHNKRLFLRSTKGGEASATLSDGREVSVDLGDLPDPLEPEAWDLHVDGAVPEGEETHDLELAELADWREIPELEHTSGTGTYRSTVALPGSWVDQGRGAYLELGRVEGGVQVRVNGRLVHPAAVPPPRFDVGPFLRRGENTIEVELTTTLKNRLVEMGSPWADNSETQPYGLLGPVRLVPYAERAVG